MKALFLLVLAVGFVGCAGLTPGITTHYDKFEGKTTIQLSGNRVIMDGGMMSATTVDFDMQYVTKGQDTLIGIMIVFRSKSWLFIENKGSLITIVNGDMIATFDAVKSDRTAESFVTGAIVRETAWYAITRNDWKRISTAKSLEFKLKGEKGSATGKLGPKNLELLRQFAAQVR